MDDIAASSLAGDYRLGYQRCLQLQQRLHIATIVEEAVQPVSDTAPFH